MWCFWIDNYLAWIEQIVGSWLSSAEQAIQQTTGGSSNLGRNFIANHMRGTGWATRARMHFPHAANYAITPLPGTQGSASTTASKYGMWGGNQLGQLVM